jgi:hypothetical protein
MPFSPTLTLVYAGLLVKFSQRSRQSVVKTTNQQPHNQTTYSTNEHAFDKLTNLPYFRHPVGSGLMIRIFIKRCSFNHNPLLPTG